MKVFFVEALDVHGIPTAQLYQGTAVGRTSNPATSKQETLKLLRRIVKFV